MIFMISHQLEEVCIEKVFHWNKILETPIKYLILFNINQFSISIYDIHIFRIFGKEMNLASQDID